MHAGMKCRYRRFKIRVYIACQEGPDSDNEGFLMKIPCILQFRISSEDCF